MIVRLLASVCLLALVGCNSLMPRKLPDEAPPLVDMEVSFSHAEEPADEGARLALDLGCPVAWIAPAAAPEGATHLRVADVGELLAPLVEVVPAQLLAGQMAALAGVDGDSFGLDDPTFKAAQERVQL